MKKVSLVFPCFNEEKNVSKMFELCKNTLSPNFSYQYIFINDGSKDNTFLEIRKLVLENKDDEIIGINFSRNFGKESGILAGLEHANGDYTVVIDSDLQQDPKYVNQMVQILNEDDDIDMVSAYQEKRKESKILTFFKNTFYNVINKISDIKFEKNASDFRTFNSKVRDAILDIREYNRFSKGIFSWVGFNTKYIPYEVNERYSGKTSWSFRSLFKYAMEGFLSYSTLPLKISSYIGTITSLAAFIYMIVVFIQKVFFEINVPGYATTIILILLFSGLNFLSLGIIGQYLSKTYMEVKNRPHYLIKNVISNKED